MSSTSARREALTATVVGLGFAGGALTAAADILHHDVREHWDACLGKTSKSMGPRLGWGAMGLFALAVLFGLSRSKWAIKDMFSSRLFCWGRKGRRRSARLQSLVPFLASLIILLGAGWWLWELSSRDIENQRCKGSLEEMQQTHQEVPTGYYSIGGMMGFLAAGCAAIFFVVQDVRKRKKERQKRYHSSKYYTSSGTDGATTDTGTGDEETDGTEEEDLAMSRRSRRSRTRTSSRRIAVL